MNNVIQSVLGLPLTDPINGGIYIAILVISALLIAWRLRKRDFVSFLIAAAIAVVAYFALKHWDVPFYLFLAGLVPIAAVVSLIHHAGRRLLMTVIAVFSTLAVAGLANMEYQSYPDIGSLDPNPVAQEMDLAQFKSMKSSDSAAIVHLDLPGTVSGFVARQATAYIPPAYWTRPTGLGLSLTCQSWFFFTATQVDRSSGSALAKQRKRPMLSSAPMGE